MYIHIYVYIYVEIYVYIYIYVCICKSQLAMYSQYINMLTGKLEIKNKKADLKVQMFLIFSDTFSM